MAGQSPCASCKLLRRRCAKDCPFAPYFPPDDPRKFAMVHRVFGASNIAKMLQELPVQQREDAVSSLVYEANARVRDPVYGCVGAISYLQNQVSQLQMQLAMARAEILCIQMQQQQDHHHHDYLHDHQPPPPNIPTTPLSILFDDDDDYGGDHNDFSFLLDNNINSLPCYSNVIIHESLKRESLFG